MDQQEDRLLLKQAVDRGQTSMARPKVFDKLRIAGTAHTKESLSSNVDKTQLKNSYIALLIVISVAILIFGLVIIFSAVQTNEDYSFTKQLVGVVIGIILMAVFARFDYKYLADAVVPLIIINVVLILSPHIPGIGVTVKGAAS